MNMNLRRISREGERGREKMWIVDCECENKPIISGRKLKRFLLWPPSKWDTKRSEMIYPIDRDLKVSPPAAPNRTGRPVAFDGFIITTDF